jgi:hypothetical protein
VWVVVVELVSETHGIIIIISFIICWLVWKKGSSGV